MADKAARHKVDFRPHFKTHQSLEIGRWFKEVGVKRITVSSLSMAEYFSSEWNDITVAFPVNIGEIDTINRLAKKISLNLCAENFESLDFLANNLKSDVAIFLKVDIGYHRTGINPIDTAFIDKLLNTIDSEARIKFKGFLGHAGHSYKCNNPEEVKTVHTTSMVVMKKLKDKYSKNYPDLIISVGDTPSCSLADDFSVADEIRPGNFAFYDLTQHAIGSNNIDQIAVAVACPIVAIHIDRCEIVIYGGGVHLSKEQLSLHAEGVIFGHAASKVSNGWGDIIPGMYVKSLSQEHGIISVPEKLIKNYSIGDHILILPVHSCMTANLMKKYVTTDGKQIDMMNSI